MKARAVTPPLVVRVGLLGLGTVGSGVAEILTRHRKLIAERSGVDIRVVRALVRTPKRKRGGAAAEVSVTTRARDIVGATDVDVVCELMGGVDPAHELIHQALDAGIPVVTANKAVVARHGPELMELAAARGTELYFEGAVAGGLPIIRTLREGLAADRISRVLGILNGTTNFILGQMESGQSYEAALAEAQRLGYAEADPTLDVNGRDAADKLAILVLLAFGLAAPPPRIPAEGITGLTPEILRDADELGYRVKLIGMGERRERGVDARVHPTFVPKGHPLSTVGGADNAVAVESDALGTTLYQGRGAGGLPTGSAVVSDLIEAARNLRAGIGGRRGGARPTGTMTLVSPKQVRGSYYVRLLAADKPGVLAAVTRIFGERGVSLATVLQRERGARGPVPIVMLTHATTQAAMEGVASALGRLRALNGRAQVIRILE